MGVTHHHHLHHGSEAEEGGLRRIAERVYQFSDTCSVYVITSGSRALLIDFGTGAVLDELESIGVEGIDWVLHTHHHRDQCQGDELLADSGTRIGVPAREAHFFEAVESFWQRPPIWGSYDCTGVFNSLTRSVPVDRRFGDYERLAWADLVVTVQPTPGHTKGSVTYLVEIGREAFAFCGDVVCAEGRVWTIYDLQWDYVDPDGLNVGLHSVHTLRKKGVDVLAPSHGEVIRDPESALGLLEERMRRLLAVVGVRFQAEVEAPVRPVVDHRFVQVSEHLVAALHPFANFYVLTAENGESLFFDYGFPSRSHVFGAGSRFTDHSLRELEELFSISAPTVVVPSHYHDDHVAGISFLQDRFKTDAWVYEKFVDILEQPRAYRIPCLWPEPLSVARTIEEGAWIDWHGFRFQARHNPGHTWYAVSLFGEVDGRRIAVTGDEILRSAVGHLRGGGPVYRNRVEPDSFSTGIRRILEFEPELLLTGHSGAIEVTRSDLDAAYAWARDLEGSWRALAAVPDEIGFALDPDVVNIRPYQADAVPGSPVTLSVEIRNHHGHEAAARLVPVVPPDWQAEPALRELSIEAGGIATTTFAIVAPLSAQVGVRHAIVVDVVLGERRLGQAAEALVKVSASSADANADA